MVSLLKTNTMKKFFSYMLILPFFLTFGKNTLYAVGIDPGSVTYSNVIYTFDPVLNTVSVMFDFDYTTGGATPTISDEWIDGFTLFCSSCGVSASIGVIPGDPSYPTELGAYSDGETNIGPFIFPAPIGYVLGSPLPIDFTYFGDGFSVAVPSTETQNGVLAICNGANCAPPPSVNCATIAAIAAGTCNNGGSDATDKDDYYTTDIEVTIAGDVSTHPIELSGILHPSSSGLVALGSYDLATDITTITFTGVNILVTGGDILAVDLMNECCFGTALAPSIAACSTPPSCVVDVCYGLHLDQDPSTTIGTGDPIVDAALYPLIDPSLGGLPSANSAADYTLVYAFVDASGNILDLQGSTTMDALPGSGYDFDPLALGVPVPPVPPLYDAYSIYAISYHTATTPAPAVGDVIGLVEASGCVCTSMCEVHHLLCCNAEVSEVNPIEDICSDEAIDASFVDPTENTGDPGGPFAGLTDYITEYYLTYEAYDGNTGATHPVNGWDRHLIIDHNATGAFDASTLNLYPDYPLPPGPGGSCQTQSITYCVWGLNIKTDELDPTAGILNNIPLTDHLYDITNTNGDWNLEWFCYTDGFVAGPNNPPSLDDPEPPVPSCTCIDVSQPICFEVFLKPQVEAGADKWICENEPPFSGPGNSVQLCDALIGGSACNATWTIVATSGSITSDPSQLSPAAGTPMTDPSLAIFTPNDDTNGWVRLQLRTEDPNNPCGFVQDFVTVYVNQAAHVNAGSDLTACQGEPVQLAGSSVFDGSETGQWTILSGGGSISNTGFTSNPSTVIYTPASSGFTGVVTLALTSNDPDASGYVTNCGTDTGVCGTYTDTKTITYGQVATAIADGPLAVCSSNALANGIVITGTATGGSTSGYWTDGNGSYSPSNQAGTITYMPTVNELAEGSITLVFNTDDPVGPCTADQDFITIIIDQDPSVVAGSDITLCETSAANPIFLSGASIGGGASSGAWSIVSGTGSLSSTSFTNNPALVTFTANGAGTTVLSLTTDDGGGLCTAVSDTRTITIDPAADVNLGADQYICTTDLPVNLANTGTTTGIWSSEGSGTFSSTTSQATVYTPSILDLNIGSVEIYFTSSDPVGVCNAINDEVLIFFSEGAFVDAGLDQEKCSSSPNVILGGSFGGSASSATWSSSGTGSFQPNETVLNATYIPSAVDIANGSVTLTLTTDNPSGGCPSATDMMLVTFNPAPSVTNGQSVSTCSGDAVAIAVVASALGTWSGGNGTFGSLSNPNTTYTPSQGEGQSSVTLTYTISDSDGDGPCGSASGTVQVNVASESYADAGPNQSGCYGTQVELGGNSSGTGILTYSWSPQVGLSCYNCPNPVATITQNRNYTLTVGSSCGTDTDLVTVAVSSLADLPGENISVCDLPYTFSAPSGYNSYRWIFNGSIVGNTQNYNATSFGVYILEVTDAGGCMNNATYQVSQANCDEPYLVQDPCVCLNNATTGGNGQFSTLITIMAPAGQDWVVTSVNNFYSINSLDPPANPLLITVGTPLTEVSSGMYQINGIHIDDTQFTITVSNGLGDSFTTNGACYYPNPSVPNLLPVYCSTDPAFVLAGSAGTASGDGVFTIDGIASTSFDPASLGVGSHLVEYTFDEDNNASNHPGCIQSTGSIVVLIEDCYDAEFLGNYVWIDTNGNGIQDGGEVGVPGVIVYLYDSSGMLVATTNTDVDGYYYFGYPGAGNYYIEIDIPTGYTVSPNNAGGDDASDSDFSLNGVSPIFTVGNNPDLDIDLGLTPVAECNDFEVAAQVSCAGEPGNYTYQVTLTMIGGNPGNGGYLITSTHPGGYNNVYTDGNVLTDGPFDVVAGQGYSYTVTVANNPSCVATASSIASGCGPTAVQLLDFTGKVRMNDNQLLWATATEVNNDYFILYRSVDGQHFEPIKNIDGAGNSNILINYHFEDMDVYPGTFYYRLDQVEYNGTVRSSEIVTLVRENQSMDALSVYPVPANDIIHLVWNSAKEDSQEFSIIDILGRKLITWEQEMESNINHYPINISGLPSGTYFIQARVNSNMVVTKFIKN